MFSTEYTVSFDVPNGIDPIRMVDNTIKGIAQRPEVFDAFRTFFSQTMPLRILEIGTGHGGLTMGLRDILRELYQPDVPFVSIDINEYPYFSVLMEKQNITFICADVFSIKEQLKNWVNEDGLSIVLCDGGDKPAEFNYFASVVKPGDIVMAHDYTGWLGHLEWNWSEITDAEVEDACRAHNMKPYMEDVMGRVMWASKRKEVSQ